MKRSTWQSGIVRIAIILAVVVLASGCSTTYYATWEALGKEKRDLLRDNVEAARDEQAEAQEQFKDALTRLKELTHFEGGKLEGMYNELKDEYEECEERAEDVRDRIEKVDDIAADLFSEWEDELEMISNSNMRRDSAGKLQATKKRYAELHRSMVQAKNRMTPVLVKFRDNVLYLKHNLNAQAIGALNAEVVSIESDVEKLIKDMEVSIAKADEFIASLPN